MDKTVDPSIAASLEPLLSKFSQLKSFYRYYFGRCLSEQAQLVSPPYSRGRSTRYSDRMGDFSVTSHFPRTTKLRNSVPLKCFPLAYDLNCFKSRINRDLLPVGSV